MGCDSAHGTIMSLAVVVVVIVGCSRMRWNADARLYTACQQIGNDVSQGCLWYLALANACLSPRPAMQFLQRDLTHLLFPWFSLCCIVKVYTTSCYRYCHHLAEHIISVSVGRAINVYVPCSKCLCSNSNSTKVDQSTHSTFLARTVRPTEG